jgi:hypothetical protein
MSIRINIADGVATRTDRVELANVASHIAANDHLAAEARVLAAFVALEDPEARPAELLGERVSYLEVSLSGNLIQLNAATFRGVVLDRMESRGPRGGCQVLWRAASKRGYQVATWSWTKADAAK